MNRALCGGSALLSCGMDESPSAAEAFIGGDGLGGSGGQGLERLVQGARDVVEREVAQSLTLGDAGAAEHEAESVGDNSSAARGDAAASD